MSSAFTRRLSGALLATLLASLGASSFNVKLLAHGLKHEMASLSHKMDSCHAPASLPGGGTQRGSDTDHELLHAGAHIQPCPLLAFEWPIPAASGIVRGWFVAPAVAYAARETPFRPPRILPSFA